MKIEELRDASALAVVTVEIHASTMKHLHQYEPGDTETQKRRTYLIGAAERIATRLRSFHHEVCGDLPPAVLEWLEGIE